MGNVVVDCCNYSQLRGNDRGLGSSNRVENSITKTYFLGPIFFFLLHGISRIVYFMLIF